MRNLKKVLALVLALVMSLSLVTIANAADFSDNADIDYSEAVDVMVAAGIIDGVGNNSFDPNGTLTREQAAKLITYMLLGENSNKLGTEGSSFNDVATTRWSAPAIEYCASMGIIDGAGDGNFYPAGRLTGYAFAKMLLTAIGYDSKIEGFTGNSWSINVATIGMEVGLHDGLEKMFGSAELSRQEAAQMALNAIKTPLVTYEKQATITVNGAEVAVGSAEAQYVTTTLAKEQRISDQRLTNASSTAPNYTVEFGEKYFPKLRLVAETDEFERPSHTWVYENEELGTYPDNDILVETYTAEVSCKTLYDLLGRSNLQDYSFDYYVDGGVGDADADDILSRSTDGFGESANGVLTQVFVDHEANNGKGAIVITSIHTWLAQATADYSANRETLSVKVFDRYDDDNNVTLSTTKTIDVDDVPEIEDVKKDQFLLVNMSEKDRTKLEIVVIDDVEILSDSTLSRFSKNSDSDPASDSNEALFDSLTTGGTKYDSSAKAFYSDEVLDLYNNKLLTGKTYNVYLDKYGYAIGVDLHTGEDNYVFITGYDLDSSAIASGTARANAIFTDGTVKAIDVNVIDTNKNITNIEGYNATDSDNDSYFETWKAADDMRNDQNWAINRWFTYTEDKGEYTLSPATRMFTTEVTADETIKCNAVRIDEKASDTNVNSMTPKTPKTARAYGNDDSIFIVAELDNVSAATDKVITGVDGLYTGVQNVEIEVTTTTDGTKITGTELCDSIYTLYDKDNYIIAAVIIGDAKGGNANLVYVKSAATAEEKIDDTYYWEFDAVVDGEIQTLTVKSKFSRTINNLKPGHVQEVRYDGEYVTSVVDLDNDNFYMDYTQRINDETVYDIGHKANTEECGISGTHQGSDSTSYRLTYNGATKQIADDLHMVSRTMYLTSDDVTAAERDQGLTFESGAKAVVHQQENGKWKWREYDSVNAAIDSLGDADGDDTNNKLGFNGRLTAVLNSNGTAKWIVIHSDTDVVTGNTSSGGGNKNKLSGTKSTNIEFADKDEIEAYITPGTAYSLKDNDSNDLATALGMNGSDVEDCIFFGYKIEDSAKKVSITITHVSSGKEYYESSGSTEVAVGNHVIYVDVLGSPVYHSAGAKGELWGGEYGQSSLKNLTWPKGEYTWEINVVGGETFSGEFTIGR